MDKLSLKRSDRNIIYQYHENKNKETIVFLHGAGSNMTQFEPQFDYFKAFYSVLNISLYGHDISYREKQFKTEEFSLDALAKDVSYLLDFLKVREVYLVGNSAGGLVALELVKQENIRISGLITFGTAPKLMYPKFLIRIITKIDAYMLRKKPEKYLTFAARACSKNQTVIKDITNIMLQSKHAAPFIRSQIGRYNYLDVIKSIVFPYLIITGPYDKSINKELKKIKRTLSTNDNITIINIDESGHFLNMDQKEIFNKTVLNFIDNHKKK